VALSLQGTNTRVLPARMPDATTRFPGNKPLDGPTRIRHLRNQDLTSPVSATPVTVRVSHAMLRLSKLTDYAVVVLVRLAEDATMQTSPGIAAATGIPEPTVAKVLKTLTAGGLVTSQRGARGGYRLHRPLDEIPIADVIKAIDGPIALAACVDGSTSECECHSVCAMRGRWDPVNDAIQQALYAITLADMKTAAIPRAFRVPASGRANPNLTPQDIAPMSAAE
jgi:FeS assembly SUF system regulator